MGCALKTIELAHTGADLYAECLARFWAATWFGTVGDSTAADQHSQEGLGASERLRDRYRLINALWLRQRVAHSKGEWQRARELSDRTLLSAPDDARLLPLRALLEFEIGDAVEGQLYLDRFFDVLSGGQTEEGVIYGLVTVPAIARLTGGNQGLDDVETTSRALLTRPNITPRAAECARAGLALIAILSGEASQAAEQYPYLNANSKTLEYNSIFAFDRLLGLLAQTMGDLDLGATHFEDALDFCRKAAYRPELAWACYDYAGLLIRRDAQGDRSKAIALLDESFALSSKLDMAPLTQRGAELRERMAGQTGNPNTYPGGLTQREVEVLQLLALVRNNREISEELVISARTVANHVASILGKTDTSNRTEAAAYATRQGLVTW